jgi:hypothetical protein
MLQDLLAPLGQVAEVEVRRHEADQHEASRKDQLHEIGEFDQLEHVEDQDCPDREHERHHHAAEQIDDDRVGRPHTGPQQSHLRAVGPFPAGQLQLLDDLAHAAADDHGAARTIVLRQGFPAQADTALLQRLQSCRQAVAAGQRTPHQEHGEKGKGPEDRNEPLLELDACEHRTLRS